MVCSLQTWEKWRERKRGELEYYIIVYYRYPGEQGSAFHAQETCPPSPTSCLEVLVGEDQRGARLGGWG